MIFELDEDQIVKCNNWINSQKSKPIKSMPAAGERFEYRFLPTGLGMVTTVYDCILNESINLTDFSNW